MGRTYQRKTQRASWSDGSLKRACETVKSGRLKLWDASKTTATVHSLQPSNVVKGSPGPSG
ncbi:hypothetical protein C0J52_11997 [Blattella germanica]|nr:hypothetical protein C0J52_11997 [Blattella germanica]